MPTQHNLTSPYRNPAGNGVPPKPTIPRVRAIRIEFEDDTEESLTPLEFGEVNLIFREGKLAEDQALRKNKRF